MGRPGCFGAPQTRGGRTAYGLIETRQCSLEALRRGIPSSTDLKLRLDGSYGSPAAGIRSVFSISNDLGGPSGNRTDQAASATDGKRIGSRFKEGKGYFGRTREQLR